MNYNIEKQNKTTMSIIKKDMGAPDKYDIFVQKIDHFQSLVEEKKNLQSQILQVQSEFEEKIKPLENELAVIIKKLESNLSKLEGTVTVSSSSQSGSQKFARGQLGASIKELLRSNPEKTFKPKDIAEALNTQGTAVSLWFNKYGVNDEDVERIPTGKGGKRFAYKIK